MYYYINKHSIIPDIYEITYSKFSGPLIEIYVANIYKLFTKLGC